MPSCKARAAARRLPEIHAGGRDLLRAVACGLAGLYNIQVDRKDRIKPIDLAPALLTPSHRAEEARKVERMKELERKAASGEINPDQLKDAPVLLTGSMIGG